MAQPTFAPVPEVGQVGPTMTTPTPEIGRAPKAGLLRPSRPVPGRGLGSPAPDAGYAFGVAHREVAKLTFADEHLRHDVELGVALVAAKRASLVGRGPTLGDVRVAMDHFGLSGVAAVDDDLARPFAGLAHSYIAQRALVDAVDAATLLGPGPKAVA
ncbi:MAG: hypothetical protein ACHQFZ_02830 [Acidimicrobiales bacterium]